MTWQETALGFEWKTADVFCFFGKRDANLQHLQTAYPGVQWARIRQTHSDFVVNSSGPRSEPLPEADAHWTRTRNLALLISTADCTPVLLYHPDKQAVASIHAGWRGVASRIVPKTIAIWNQDLGKHDEMKSWIGPHIQFDSFEVGTDVSAQLLGSVTHPPALCSRERPDGKMEIDLNLLVKTQLLESGIAPENIANLPLDTKSDLRFHSHRRDREKSGRQLSFILLR